MPNDKATPKELKVTDKRIFTPEGEIREEFRQDIRPSDPDPSAPAQPATSEQVPAPATASAAEPRSEPAAAPSKPASPYFTALVDQLFMQAAMYLGVAPKGYQAPPMKPNPAAAREIIEMLVVLQEKTEGNLAPDESEFLKSAISELKLAYVQRTKNI